MNCHCNTNVLFWLTLLVHVAFRNALWIEWLDFWAYVAKTKKLISYPKLSVSFKVIFSFSAFSLEPGRLSTGTWFGKYLILKNDHHCEKGIKCLTQINHIGSYVVLQIFKSTCDALGTHFKYKKVKLTTSSTRQQKIPTLLALLISPLESQIKHTKD